MSRRPLPSWASKPIAGPAHLLIESSYSYSSLFNPTNKLILLVGGGDLMSRHGIDVSECSNAVNLESIGLFACNFFTVC